MMTPSKYLSVVLHIMAKGNFCFRIVLQNNIYLIPQIINIIKTYWSSISIMLYCDLFSRGYDLINLFYSIGNKSCSIQSRYTGNKVFTFVHGNEYADSVCLPDRHSHLFSYLTKQRICYHNADGTNDNVSPATGNDDGILSGGGTSGACLHHGSSCNGIGADGS